MATIYISKGLQLIGQVIATAFSGIAFSQAYSYFSLYSRDPLGIKAFVAVLVVLILFAVVGQTMSLFNSLITQASLSSPHFPVIHYVPLYTNVVAISLSQLYFVQRAYRGWQSKILAGALTTLVAFDTASWFIVNYCSIKTNAAKSMAEVLADVTVLNRWVIINSAASTATDVLISAALAAKLIQTRRLADGFNINTDSVIGSLLQMTLGTAATTSCITLYVLIAVKVQPLGSSYHLILGDSTAVSAVSCVLYCLNSRQRLRLMGAGITSSRSETGPTSGNFVGSGSQGRVPGSSGFGVGGVKNNVVSGISIQLETYIETTEPDERGERGDIEKGRMATG